MDKMLMLRVRPAADRARVWDALLGIERELLANTALVNGEAAAAVLDQMAQRDREMAADLVLVITGRPADLLPPPVAAGDDPLATAVAAAETAGRQFDRILAEVSPDLLATKKDARRRVLALTRRRCLADARLARELLKQRQALAVKHQTGAREIFLAALQAAHRDFTTTMALLPEDEWASRPVCGFWTMADLIGHLTDWDQVLWRWAAGDNSRWVQRGIVWPEDGSMDAFNGQMRDSRLGQPLVALRREAEETRRGVVDFVRQMAEEGLNRPVGPETSFAPTTYQRLGIIVEHYLEHAAWLRRELPLSVPGYLKRFKGPYI